MPRKQSVPRQLASEKLSKCPSCGYEYTPGDKRTEIRKLLFARYSKTRKLLSKASKGIMEDVPSDKKSYKYYAFLYGLKNIHDDVINWAVPIFIKRKEYKLGKGFSYLRAMIHNANDDFKVKKAAELRLKGKTPKSIKQKRKELGYVSRNTVSSERSTGSRNSSSS